MKKIKPELKTSLLHNVSLVNNTADILDLHEPLLEPIVNAPSGEPAGSIIKTEKPNIETKQSVHLTPLKTGKELGQPKPGPLEALMNIITPRLKNPLNTTSFFPKLGFAWINPIFETGSKKILQPSDLFSVAPQNRIEKMAEDYAEHIKSVPLPHKNNPLKVIYSQIKWRYSIAVYLFVFAAGAQIVAPLLYTQFMIYFRSFTTDKELYLWPIVIIFSIAFDLLLRVILINQSLFHVNFNGTRLAVTLRHEIYSKMLRMSSIHLEHFVGTTLVNLLTFDIDNMVGGLLILPNFIAAFGVLLFQFIFLYSLGYYTFSLAVLLIIFVTLLYNVHKHTRSWKLKLLHFTDDLSKQLKEHIFNVDCVKTNRFEEVFYRRLTRKQKTESKDIRSYLRWCQVASIMNFIFPTIFGLVFFGLHVVLGRDHISLQETYLVLTVLSIMRTPISLINDGFEKYPEHAVSRLRIESFLMKIVEKNSMITQNPVFPAGKIVLANCHFGFNSFIKDSEKTSRMAESPTILEKLTLIIEAGSNMAVVGPSGAGKSFFLLSLMGETRILKGGCTMNGKIFYLPEEYVLTEDSIYQNIVCGLPYDEERYKTALNLCKLSESFKDIDGQDLMILHDNGANITHKLRKRIMLARMLYQEYDIYLIDGFLNDFNIEFRDYIVNIIFKKILRNKTVIVATDRADICRSFDEVLVFNEGKLKQHGRYDKLVAQKESYFTLLIGGGNETDDDKNEKLLAAIIDAESQGKGGESTPLKKIHWNPEHHHNLDQNKPGSLTNPYLPIRSSRNWQIIFKMFFFNDGKFLPFLYIVFLILSQVMTYAFIWFIAEWKARAFHMFPIDYIIAYGGITLVALIFLILTSVVLIRLFRKISLRLFLMIIRSLMARDVAWFRRTPTSRILNVFVNDYTEVDQLMGLSVNSFLQNFIRLNVGLVILLYKTYILGVTLVLVHLTLIVILWRFLKTDRCIKQILVKNRAQLVTRVVDTHKGLLHYRNSGVLNYIKGNFFAVHDIFQNAKSMDGNFAHRWLMARALPLASLYPILCLLDVFFKVLVNIQPDFTLHNIKFAVALDMCFSMIPLVSALVRNETFYSDIERIIAYICEDQPSAAAQDYRVNKPVLIPSMVPERLKAQPEIDGSIKFIDVSFMYPEMNSFALINSSFEIASRERVALVGRAGSGKHTVLSIMAGLTVPSSLKSGRIFLGSINATRSLQDYLGDQIYELNSDYCLFEGDLRMNIDPNRRFTDEAIINVLNYIGFWSLYKLEPDLKIQNAVLGWAGQDDPFYLEEDHKTHLEHRRSNLSFHKRDSVVETEGSRSNHDVAIEVDLEQNAKQKLGLFYDNVLNHNPIVEINKEIERLKRRGVSFVDVGDGKVNDRPIQDDTIVPRNAGKYLESPDRKNLASVVLHKEAEDFKRQRKAVPLPQKQLKFEIEKIKKKLLTPKRSNKSPKISSIPALDKFKGLSTQQIINGYLGNTEPTVQELQEDILSREADGFKLTLNSCSTPKKPQKDLTILSRKEPQEPQESQPEPVLDQMFSRYVESATRNINTHSQFKDLGQPLTAQRSQNISGSNDLAFRLINKETDGLSSIHQVGPDKLSLRNPIPSLNLSTIVQPKPEAFKNNSPHRNADHPRTERPDDSWSQLSHSMNDALREVRDTILRGRLCLDQIGTLRMMWRTPRPKKTLSQNAT